MLKTFDNKATGMRKLLNLLESKILCRYGTPDVFNEAFAILGIRTSVSVAASTTLASLLVAGHMRMCVGISEQRDFVHSLQVGEPALALAATRLIYKDKSTDWQKIIQSLVHALGSGYADAGYRGELAVQILLLMVFDQAFAFQLGEYSSTTSMNSITETTRLSAVPLEVFLQVLLGADKFKEFASEDDIAAKVDGKYVRFLQFVQTFNQVSSLTLVECFLRSNAIACNFNSKGCDLVIPVFCLNEGETDADITADRMSVILVQVKCYARGMSETVATEACSLRLTRSFCGIVDCNEDLDYLSILIDVGLPDETCDVRLITRDDVQDFVDTVTAPRLKKLKRAKKTKPIVDQMQISFCIESLTPKYIQKVADFPAVEAFSSLVKARSLPFKTETASAAHLKALKINLGHLAPE
jgi:hypothetical protein